MKILIIPPGDLPIPAEMGGAIETLTEYLIKENEFHEEPFEIDIINRKQSMRKYDFKYTQIRFCTYGRMYRVLYNFFYKLIRFITLRKVYIPNYFIHYINEILLHETYDLIVVEGEYLQGLTIKAKDTPVYLHLHTDLLYNGVLREKDVAKVYTKIICVSDFIASRVKTIPKLNKNKVWVLKNCSDMMITDFAENFMNLKDKLGVNNDIVFSYFGRISKEKGVIELVKAFSKLKIKKCKLLIVGAEEYGNSKETSYTKDIKKIIDDYMLHDRVVFTGYIEHKRLPIYYSISDCVMIPSICNEAAPLVAVEAQQCGVPVIYTKIGGIPEYVDENASIGVEYDGSLIENLTQAMYLIACEPQILFSMKRYLKCQNEKELYTTKQYYNRFRDIIQ